jgi:peptidoglycan-N-acetylglucosamine deacetylase
MSITIIVSLYMKKIIVTTSWDDGHPADLKLGKLLKKYDIPATFYIPIKNVEERKTMSEREIKKISKDFDIGGHTYNHQRLTLLSDKEAFKEIIEGKKSLEKICDKNVEMFCYPGGEYQKKHIDMVKKTGFIGARTIRVLEYNVPNDYYQIGTTIQKGNNIYGHIFPHLLKSGFTENIDLCSHLVFKYLISANTFDFCNEAFNFIKKRGGIFHLWGHSYNIEENNYWTELEEIFKSIKELSQKYDVYLLDNTQLIKYIGKNKI